MSVTLRAEHIAIRYITGDFKDIGIKEYVVRNLTHNYHVNEFMAVDDVSFELEQGDMLGIIGSNGAGKSTLLKAIAGIMEPTRGKIEVNGEVAALLELGSGFDGDLTVKENAYLRGAMLGYTRDFMDATYDQIIDFAELRGFEDRPFKQLSSGMKSRLAFSIASLVKPDILILDEVLSVGDGAFQEKSARKMREIIAGGTTTILVSHSLEQIRELCNKVLWLDHGKQIAFGETDGICDRYEAFLCDGGAVLPEKPDSREEELSQPVRESVSMPKQKIRPLTFVYAIVLGLFAALIVHMTAEHIAQSSPAVDTILIAAEEGEVTYRGGAMGDIWYSPSDNVLKSDGWEPDWDEVTYHATDGQYLSVGFPRGSGRTLTFNVGPDQGIAKVVVDGKELHFDLFNENTVPLGLPYALPDTRPRPSGAGWLSITAFLLVAAVTVCLSVNDKTRKCRKEVTSTGLRK